jgi:hypothetical protein
MLMMECVPSSWSLSTLPHSHADRQAEFKTITMHSSF